MSVSEELEYQETIALLQEEVVRLENELRLRGEEEAGAVDDQIGDTAAEEEANRQIASLIGELANRDETINLLLDQSRLFEEAESADQANWEQLNQWVQELERRVEAGGGSTGPLKQELEEERRKTRLERETFQVERRSWDAQRTAMESEVEKLRGLLGQAARQPAVAANDSVLEALEQENRRLRSVASELARVSAVAAEVELLRDRLVTTEQELAKTARELQGIVDDQKRERNEYEAMVAELRSQLAHETLKRQETQVLTAVVPGGKPDGATMSPDERIRVLRLHLNEIHEKEAEERAQRTLSARLSRLWWHTGPRG
ncbi:coiled-coil domain-containing protein [Singulisphaera acidiphila]|uniref:Uncharacterized protein n=1 Tax=Singulisphaera acidiphila (strain ATCC BAA-1392 / DSM 18658 / VKM B-2454 / MOB10) TaxID=886293 RepID=L0DFU2_SINAD|nr:hypothetical protein [Singulisphaera acidiphila]AGA27688.1 hypothetical protein Sinac_3427 [Singulisphaera acidiphila DSM 18658]